MIQTAITIKKVESKSITPRVSLPFILQYFLRLFFDRNMNTLCFTNYKEKYKK